MANVNIADNEAWKELIKVLDTYEIKYRLNVKHIVASIASDEDSTFYFRTDSTRVSLKPSLRTAFEQIDKGLYFVKSDIGESPGFINPTPFVKTDDIERFIKELYYAANGISEDRELTPDDITENIVIIKINKRYSPDMSALELYEATRGIWKRKIESVEIADYCLSVFKGTVVEVYRIEEWYPAGTTEYKTRILNQEDLANRIEFIGSVAEDTIQRKYLGKSVKNLYKNGEADPVKVFLARNNNNGLGGASVSGNMRILIGDDVSNLKIYEIINKYFGQQYTGWMKAWYDINDEYAAWFPTITETDDRPSGSWGGTKTHSNTLSADGKTILEINHDETAEAVVPEEDKYNKRRFVFGRINGKFRFLGVFERRLEKNADKLAFRHERIAIGADLKTFELITESDDFWPSNDEYPVDLSKEDWKRFIREVEYPKHKGCMRVLKCYVEIGGTASPKKLAEIYKGHPTVYTSSVTQTCRRAVKYFDMEPCPDEKNDTSWFFPIAFQGRRGSGNDKGTYVYRMRRELMDALNELSLDDIDLEYKTRKGVEEMSNAQFDKNIILYGPPGTGKTYISVIYSVAICEGKSLDEVENDSYEDILERYRKLKEEGRIAFTTFHQSYGYEEFIEGIKPIMGEEGPDIGYRIEPGVFKRFCMNARKKNVVPNQEIPDVGNARVWCVLLDGTGVSDLKKQCFEDGTIRIGWKNWPGEITSATEGLNDKVRRILLNFQDEMEVGDIVVVERSNKTIDGIGIIAGDYEYDESDKWPRKRSVKWLMTGQEIDITELNGGKNLDRNSVYPLNRVSADGILALVDTQGDVDIATEERPFVFIVDEINRGNISKIFGELITLIEDTKRAGMPEAASAKLPYSGEVFSVPNNVYILGTMNTADRSIALMDTALRRRFQFIEMMPNSEVLDSLGVGTIEVDGVELNVSRMLDVMNARIEYLFDREHTIGHAFFTKLKNDATLETLAGIFEKNVIPLLQEYFYEDYEKIQLVLGDNGKEDEFKFILDQKLDIKSIFNGSPEIDIPEKGYIIQHEAFRKLESYKQIGKNL